MKSLKRLSCCNSYLSTVILSPEHRISTHGHYLYLAISCTFTVYSSQPWNPSLHSSPLSFGVLVNSSQQLETHPARFTQQFITNISTLPNTGSSGLDQLLLQLSFDLQHLLLGPHQVIALLQLFLLLPAWDWISSLWVKIFMCFFSSLSSRASC